MEKLIYIMEKLIKLRSELSVPKNQYNSFGKYKYRSQEDILEAVKPLLEKYDLLLTITDEMIMLGNRFYVKATVVISDDEKEIASSGFAREPENKKGMDESQISGTASSYARKYALNALFLIDDTKDADTDEHHKVTTKSEPKPFDRNVAIKYIDNLMVELNYSDEKAVAIQAKYTNAKTRADFTLIQKEVI